MGIVHTNTQGVIVLKAGAFCASAATLISSVLVVVFWMGPAYAFHPWYEAPIDVVIVCLYTVIPAGLFGFVSGSLGGLYLIARGQRTNSSVRLLVEAAVVGTLLSTLFPLFSFVMGFGTVGNGIDWKAISFSVAVGCPVSLLCAAIFRASFLGERPDPASSRSADLRP